MANEDEEDCKRFRIKLRNGTNMYFTLGDNFVQASPPFENRPENMETRMLLDDFCDAITKALGGSNE